MAGAYAGQARRPGPCCKLGPARPLVGSGASFKAAEASTASMAVASSAAEPAAQHLTQQAATDFLIRQRAT